VRADAAVGDVHHLSFWPCLPVGHLRHASNGAPMTR
jgi:hypothetical protein